MWTLTVKMGNAIAHQYTADTWQEIDKVFSSLMMCEELAEPGYAWEYVIFQKQEKSTDTTADWIGA